MTTEQRFETQPAESGRELRSLKPDIVCLDSHQFRINYSIPQDVTDELEKLFDRVPEIKYEEIPNHLKAYEVGSGEAIALDFCPVDKDQAAPRSE
ncbi:hypothetical protein N7491_000282 [Penicillium cf. griseofulvum]|uniref:Uncharacterized protein n=1 Tax=Penicillium cf. griseofulvum TaxID=2972120 RepID=A0A9W9JLJ7_9EURO|nr:hypothetical protein N7472_004362 [Penicillium cf. griseofulvum]KAJ5451100.1 hypothetical protein N7491_000282 [Penicillium cf. griseofulvum]